MKGSKLLIVLGTALSLAAFNYPGMKENQAAPAVVPSSRIAEQFKGLRALPVIPSAVVPTREESPTPLVTAEPLLDADLLKHMADNAGDLKLVQIVQGSVNEYVPIEVNAPGVTVRRVEVDGKLLKLIVEPSSPVAQSAPTATQTPAQAAGCANGACGFQQYNQYGKPVYQQSNQQSAGVFNGRLRRGAGRIIRPRSWFGGC